MSTKSASSPAAAKSTKKAAAKSPAKTGAAAKSTAKKAPAKTGAAAKSTAKKTPAKSPAKTSAAAKSTAKRAPVKSPAKTPATRAPRGRATDWLARFDAQLAELQANPGVKVLSTWRGRPAAPAQLAAIEGALGVTLDPTFHALYGAANGLAQVWVPVSEARGLKALPGRPRLADLEGLPDTAGIVFFPPLEEVLGVSGAPVLDYARFMDDAPTRWGFDFPGNYYTPALRRVGDGLVVQVGDDHGAAWDGVLVALADYLQIVLSTWGTLGARRALAQRKAPPKATSLAALLPSKKKQDARAFLRALERAAMDAHFARHHEGPEDAEQIAEWLDLAQRGLASPDDHALGFALQIVAALGPAAAGLQGDLLTCARAPSRRLQNLARALDALPPVPLGAAFAPLLKAANSADVALARVLARSLDLDPSPAALWFDAIAATRETALLVTLYLESPQLRAAAAERLAPQIAALPPEPEHWVGRAHYAALAWGALHPERVPPAVLAHILHLLREEWSAGEFFDRLVAWPTLDAHVEALVSAAFAQNTPEARSGLGRALAGRKGGLAAMLAHAERDPHVFFGEVLPTLEADADARATLVAAAARALAKVRGAGGDEGELIGALLYLGAYSELVGAAEAVLLHLEYGAPALQRCAAAALLHLELSEAQGRKARAALTTLVGRAQGETRARLEASLAALA